MIYRSTDLRNFILKFPAIILSLLITEGVQAQISSDLSLSTQVTTEDNLNFTITEGDRAGNNLFHSFQEFSVPTNGSVVFDNSVTVENIINRVTGDFSSNIDGLIEANGIANVFLINPNGIIFGENAVLNIGGSFLATTAESLLFNDGIEFSTRNNNSKPLLTINVPLGVRFGNNPGTITNRSQFSIPNPNPLVGDKVGLSVRPEKTLALIGGDINIDGGIITASQGKIELGSVADNNIVNFDISTDSWNFDYGKVSQFKNIVLDNLALVNGSGEGGGAIHLQGKEIRVLNGSGIISDTLGAIDGKDITINASELVEIRGSDPTLQNIDPLVPGIIVPLPSKLSTNTFAQGNGGTINIITSDLFVFDGAKIELQTIGNPAATEINFFGNGGNLTINASGSILLKGARPIIRIEPNARDFIAPGLSLERATEINQASIISTASLSNASGGDIKIFTNSLNIRDGNVISASPLSEGNGGNITITATDSIAVIGTSPRSGSTNSAIASSTVFGDGNSGNIEITTNNLLLKNGGAISTNTGTDGNAGKIFINASEIEINGISPNGEFPSGLGSETFNVGNAGDLVIKTQKLLITNQGIISVEGSGSGVPGSLVINAKSIELNNEGTITAETNSAQGIVDITVAENIVLRNGSQISAEAKENANGGNVMISAKFVIALPSENSDIVANAITGNGGNITITTEGIVGLEETEGSLNDGLSEINASSEFGKSGSVTIVTPDGQTAEPEREVNTDVASLDKSSLDNFCRNIGKSSYVLTGRGGLPLSSEQNTSVLINWEDWRILEGANQSETTSQNISNTAGGLAYKNVNYFPQLAQGWVVNEQGQVILTAEPLMITPHPQQLTNPGC
ncbi:MAG: filamentous hemagglutinin N-terminal domain-containing protein [Xenococcus sp. (in: cyanobacteria)]